MRRLGAVVLAVVLACAGSAATGSPARAEDPGTITSYLGDMAVDAAGTVHVFERITVRFTSPRHGILREFDRPVPGPIVGFPELSSIRVLRDGHQERTKISRGSSGVEVRIGDPARTITGTHVYTIIYEAKNAVVGSGSDSEFFWYLIGDRWRLPILRTDFHVHLPGRVSEGSCGIGEETERCDGTGTHDLRMSTGRLDPGTPVTLRADFTPGEDGGTVNDELSGIGSGIGLGLGFRLPPVPWGFVPAILGLGAVLGVIGLLSD